MANLNEPKNWNDLIGLTKPKVIGSFFLIAAFFILIRFLGGFSSGTVSRWIFFGVFALFLLFSRMTPLIMYGIRFDFFLAFGFAIAFSPWIAVLVWWITIPIHWYLTVKETYFDPIIMKEPVRVISYSVQFIVMMLIVAGFGRLFSYQAIMENLVVWDLGFYLIWIILSGLWRGVTGKPVFSLFASNGTISFLINIWLINQFGVEYIQFLMNI